MKFKYFNVTGRLISIHPATITSDVKCDTVDNKPLEERTFELSSGTYPWVKMWDYGGARGLSILVSAQKDNTSG